MHPLLLRQLKKCFAAPTSLPDEVRRFAEMADEAYRQGDDDRAMLERSMELSSHELLTRNTKLAAAEQKYREIFENVTEGIFQVTAEGQYLSVNPAMARLFGYSCPDQFRTEVKSDAQMYASPARRAEILRAVDRHGSVTNWESEVRHKDGRSFWVTETVRLVRDVRGERQYYEGTVWDITTRKQAEREREELQGRMISVSRQAGMAEVATGVLHNVGNVLNSINVSASVIAKRLGESKLGSVARIAEMFREQGDALGAFVTQDEKGKKIPALLTMLVEHLIGERQAIVEELASLTTNIEHVNQIVAAQQNYAKGGGMIQEVSPSELVEDAIRVNAESLARHHVEVEREIAPLPPVLTDKHQVLQILINLITNAKHAMHQIEGVRRLTIRVQPLPTDSSRFTIEVADCGIGVAEENLAKIFSHGFTTRADGHGFGLHTSALAATGMGGSLRAFSEGLGRGAVFTLELPLTAVNHSEQARRAA